MGQTGRLERKVVDLEGQLASERKKLEHECDLREAKEGELSKFMGQAMIDRQEHLKLLRESAGFGVQMSQKSERMRGLEREVSELTARCREADQQTQRDAAWLLSGGVALRPVFKEKDT